MMMKTYPHLPFHLKRVMLNSSSLKLEKKGWASELINKSMGWYINSVLLWWHWFRRCPVCFLPESNCPRFVLLCQDALTSARHNCVQLSRKVAAMWHDLQGILGWGCTGRKSVFQQLDGTPLGHIYSYVHQGNKHASSVLHNLYQLN